MKKDRRQFLKNTALATIAVGATPLIGSAKTLSKNDEKNLEKTGCNVLTQDLYGTGPFYTENAPLINDGIIAPLSEPGTRLIISGIVKNLDCTEVIPDTELDLWHADDAAVYDNTGFHLRGKILTNAAGFYSFETILPGKYLNGSQLRPRHIHFKITTPGYPTFTTQLYFEGDTSIPIDAAASVTSGSFDATHRIIELIDNGGVLEGNWDIVIDGDGVLGTSDLHLSYGMIYSASPSPFTDELQIHYGIFKPSNVVLEVFNLQGQMVANIDQQHLKAEKYTAVWRPDSSIPTGMYFCVLKMDNLQVHYQKVIKK